MTEAHTGSDPNVPVGAEERDLEQRARRARGRLLQLAAFGGALLGGFIGVVLGAVSGTHASGVFTFPALLSLLAGYGAGYLVGRGTFALAAGRDPAAAAHWNGLVWLLLVTPAFMLAGTVAAGVGVVGSGQVSIGIGDALGGILTTLIVAWVVLAPLPSPSRPP